MSQRLLNVCSELASIADLFKSFSEEHADKDEQVLEKGLKYFQDALKFDISPLINGLQEEIRTTTDNLQNLANLKQTRIENIFNLVNAQLEGAFSRQANIVVKRSKIEDAVKTLRKLPLFGYI